MTDHIETFDETGIVLQSGERLDADIIVTATGLELLALGGVTPVVDGEEVNLADTFTYKSFMYSGVPNLGTTFGYINASWTLRADLVARYICRLLNTMDRARRDSRGPGRQRPRHAAAALHRRLPGRLHDQRKIHLYPKQSDRDPWTASQSYSVRQEAPARPGRGGRRRRDRVLVTGARAGDHGLTRQ